MFTLQKEIRISIITLILSGMLTTIAAAQHAVSTKPAVNAVNPASIDLTQPTLFIVPYSHLDDIWRWSYPQTIRDFLKNTLDENFAAFEKYPHFVFNWSGARPLRLVALVLSGTV